MGEIVDLIHSKQIFAVGAIFARERSTTFERDCHDEEKVATPKLSNPDAVTFLTSQHREVEELFKEIEAADDELARTPLFATLAEKIEAHAQIEEKIMYPAGKPVDEDQTLEAYEEHGMVRDMIAKIYDVGVSDPTFTAKVTVLKEMIEHHVKEEEETYFPEMAKALGEERIQELGAELVAKFAEVETDLEDQLPLAMAVKKKLKHTATEHHHA